MTIEFTLSGQREAHEPPEARGTRRDAVRLLVSRRRTGEITHHAFGDLASVLLPGDLVVVNTSATLPAAVPAAAVPAVPAAAGSAAPGSTAAGSTAAGSTAAGSPVCSPAGSPAGSPGDDLAVHFSTPLPDGAWLIELRARRPGGAGSAPYAGGTPGQVVALPGGARLTLLARETKRLWRARLSTAVVPYLLRHGTPIRYSYVGRDWPLEAYQTVFGVRPGSAEMPSASRPFTAEVVTRLVSRGMVFAPLRLDTGVSSLEGDEDPYPEPYDVPPATARLVNLTRASGGRVIAAGTTVVRALETCAGPEGLVSASAGWTSQVVTPERGLRAVDGLLTGFHEPRSTHLLMLEAFAGPGLLSRCYAAAREHGYLWHEFGDVHLLLP
jgi:S-adenosylmethionine:tRNA ribosyltransferase-isomerase